MDRKRTNLCVSVDVTKAAEVLEVVRRVGASVCMVKVRLYTGGGGQREETVGEGLGFWLTVLSAGVGYLSRRTAILLKTLLSSLQMSLSSFQSSLIL